jgi:hypothetical protein
LEECKTDEGWEHFMKHTFTRWKALCDSGDKKAKAMMECKPLRTTVEKVEKTSFTMRAWRLVV